MPIITDITLGEFVGLLMIPLTIVLIPSVIYFARTHATIQVIKSGLLSREKQDEKTDGTLTELAKQVGKLADVVHDIEVSKASNDTLIKVLMKDIEELKLQVGK